MTGLPVLLNLAGRPVILLGEGPPADAKRRLLERAGAAVTNDERATAALAIVAVEDDQEAQAAIERLRLRGILVNAVDRPALCDFTLPAIVDRDPVLVAISTGGVSAGLAAALRQRLEAILPAGLGELALTLKSARDRIRTRWPESGDRRRAIGAALASGGILDPLAAHGADSVARWLDGDDDGAKDRLVRIMLRSDDPDELTLREARWLAQADRVFHAPEAPLAILDRARADAERIATNDVPASPGPGLSVIVGYAA
ncbi:precorrin-2 dehydrogenase/sirohydrochlorin ferrochelatase family protein [Stakelama marina]|uniref:precorrin-2 dehydrogenase n=1 Tax=Stakelama marina TaxID=2826939 RepID=A0A8T4ILC2_9SPHN|nr:bifunctional precorrin-2 dehydrogenase/sirohydrochlorin ferrochelatase [Stakelama marina]MBR0553149.1 siroheme synthase [Stakelama marina]